jgi:hypothetical protein
MRRLLFLFACAISVVTLLSACASRIDMNYGTSYKLAKFNQIYNPYAERNLEPVYGLDGLTVGNVMERYHAGFKEKSTAPSFILSVGGVGQ